MESNEIENASATACKVMLDNALAGCVVGANGNVCAFYGHHGLITSNGQDAADIIKAIAQLLARHEYEGHDGSK